VPTVKVLSTRTIPRPSSVVDVTVEGNHNLFVADNEDQQFVLAHNCFMERNGLLVDKKYAVYLQGPSSPVLKEIRDEEAKFKRLPEVIEADRRLKQKSNVRSRAGGLFGKASNTAVAGVFDPGKPAHQAMLFFEVKKLPVVNRTKHDKASIDDEFKKKYRDDPVVKAFSRVEEAKKMMSTFVSGYYKLLVKRTDNADGRLRPRYGSLFVITDRSCLAPWVSVTTSRGEIPISQVVAGDVVKTHNNRWKRVSKSWIKGRERMLRVTLDNGQEITGTQAHKVMLHDGTWTTLGAIHDMLVEHGGEPRDASEYT